MLTTIRNAIRGLRPEDPGRLHEFKLKTQDLSWKSPETISSLSTLFAAIDELAAAEVAYYYRRRGTRAWISGATRFGAWALGSVGLLLPLLNSTDVPAIKGVGQYGYAFLALAASCLAANSLFGGTDGHIRFVSTQLNLERLITAYRIKWCEYLATVEKSGVELGNGFEIVKNYAKELHETTISETGRWGEGLLAALETYQQSIKSRTAGKTEPK